tara:strand:- start:1383 stop:1895 length:513 start_codon:yes stop_codon:yes gene_type:complete
MKLFKFNLFFLFFFVLNISEAFSENNIALIDLDKILKNSNIGKTILKEIDELNSKNIKELKIKENELKQLEEDLKKKQNIISKDEFQKEVKTLKDKLAQFRKLKDDMVKNFENKKNANLNSFFKNINPIIQNYMDKNSIDILLERKNVFIGKTDSDITDIMIKEINKKFN